MNDIVITVDSSQVRTGSQDLKEMANQALNTLRATKQLSGQSNLDRHFASIDRQISRVNTNMSNYSRFTSQAANSSGQFGVVTQQAGYQIGDFLVQIQSGTNWMVAFGQQATQLVGVLPMMTGAFGLSSGALIALSAGLGIIIPLVTALGALWMRSSAEVEVAADKYVEALDKISKRAEETRIKIEALELGVSEEQVLPLEKINVLQEKRLNLIQEMLDESYRLQKLEAETGDDYSYILEGYQEKIALLNEDIAGTQELLNLDKDRAQQLKDIEGSSAFASNYITLIAERALDAAEASGQIDFSSAVSSAAALAEQLGVSVELASKMMSMGFGQKKAVVLDPRSPNYDPIAASMEEIKGEYGRVSPFAPSRQITPRTGGGSGGGSSSRLKEEIKLTKELTEAEKERQGILDTVNSSLETGFLDMVKGTKTVGEAFRSMAAAIIEELFRVLVVQKLVGGITSAFTGGGGFTNAQAGRLTGGGRASGGSMMAGGSYLVGENGPEIVVPRHSGTVVNANQTSGAMAGSGGITVQNNITVTGSDAAMVRQEVAKMIPQITSATKAAVIDAKQRGGQMGAAFR